MFQTVFLDFAATADLAKVFFNVSIRLILILDCFENDEFFYIDIVYYLIT